MRKKKIIGMIFISIIIIIAVMSLDIRFRYDLSVLDFYKYNSPLSSEDEAILKDRPLLIGVFDDPPLAFINVFNNHNSGIIVDYLSQLAIELRTDVLLKVGSKEGIYDAIESDDIIISVMERSPETEKNYELSQSLCVVKGKILLPTHLEINDAKELEGLTVAVLEKDNEGGMLQEQLSTQYNIKSIEVDNIYQCFALIKNGSVVGFAGDDMVAAQFVNVTNQADRFSFLSEILYEKSYCLGVKKENINVLSTLNKGILVLKKKNLISQTQYKWLGNFDSDSIDLRKVELAYKIFLAATLIIVFFSSWNYIITQRVNMRTRELFESKKELRLIIDTLDRGIVVIDNDLTIVECNDAVTQLLGVQKSDLLGRPYRSIDALQPFVDETNSNKVSLIGHEYYYVTNQRYAGNKRLLTIENYTEKFTTERRLRQESKMVAVGQLSAGLAHEIRNPLGLIKSYIYIIEQYFGDDLFKHSVSVINDSVGRINKLIDNLLRFSRLSNDENKAVDVESLVDVILTLEDKHLKENDIEVKLTVSGKIRPIVMNEDVLKMIMLNLLNNSIDSFVNTEREEKRIGIELEFEDSQLKITIRDNGCGIEREALDSIFNPFYSTKETGTGLGLYIISTEISNNEGTISVDSKVNVGTQFQIILPIKG